MQVRWSHISNFDYISSCTGKQIVFKKKKVKNTEEIKRFWSVFPTFLQPEFPERGMRETKPFGIRC